MGGPFSRHIACSISSAFTIHRRGFSRRERCDPGCTSQRHCIHDQGHVYHFQTVPSGVAIAHACRGVVRCGTRGTSERRHRYLRSPMRSTALEPLQPTASFRCRYIPTSHFSRTTEPPPACLPACLQLRLYVELKSLEIRTETWQETLDGQEGGAEARFNPLEAGWNHEPLDHTRSRGRDRLDYGCPYSRADDVEFNVRFL